MQDHPVNTQLVSVIWHTTRVSHLTHNPCQSSDTQPVPVIWHTTRVSHLTHNLCPSSDTQPMSVIWPTTRVSHLTHNLCPSSDTQPMSVIWHTTHVSHLTHNPCQSSACTDWGCTKFGQNHQGPFMYYSSNTGVEQIPTWVQKENCWDQTLDCSVMRLEL